MRSAHNGLPDNRVLFTPPDYFIDEVTPLELVLPAIGISHELDIRLRRHGYSLQPQWSGLLDATKTLELEQPLGLTYGLDSRDDDADPEVEMFPSTEFPRLSDDAPTILDQRKFDFELAIHIDPSPTAKEKSAQQANVATWMGLLLASDLEKEDGPELMLNRFKTASSKSKVAS
jgi:hypothetical protein